MRPERIYLLFITIAYFLVGLGALGTAVENFSKPIPILESLFSTLFLFGFFAVFFPFIIVLPLPILLGGGSGGPSSEWLLLLGTVAVVLSVAGLYALLRIDSSPRLIVIWWGILSLSGVIALYNLISFALDFHFSLGNFIPVVVMFFAVQSLHHRLIKPTL